MRANSPSAFFTSLTLHSAVAALMVFFSYYTLWRHGPPPVIFELVAGPPTAPDELVAPALGNSLTPVKIAPPQAQPPPEPKAVETPPESDVRPPPPKPKSDNSLLKEMKRREKMSYKDYLKKHPIPKRAPQSAATTPARKNVPRIDAEGIAQGVKGGSTTNKRGGGGGKALTREEQNEFNTYISFLHSVLKEAYSGPGGGLKTTVIFDITSSGVILNPRILKSSGNREVDEAVLDAFRRIKAIGPTPNGKSESDWTLIFNVQDEN